MEIEWKIRVMGNVDVTHRENPGATAEEKAGSSIWSIDAETVVRFKSAVSPGQITIPERFISVISCRISGKGACEMLCWTT